MIIKKTFHFYAGHRNETLIDKCRNPHGHLYRVACCFAVQRDPNNPGISTLFSDFDVVGAYLKEQWDHTFVINQNDPLLKAMEKADNGIPFHFKILPRTPSVENICYELFREILNLGGACEQLIQIEVKETESSTIIYNVDDYVGDEATIDVPAEKCKHTNMSQSGWCLDCRMTEFQIKVERRNASRGE